MLDEIYAHFRSRLAGLDERLVVAQDDGLFYGLLLPGVDPKSPWAYFGGARLGKAYVSYYLMPVYKNPALLEGVSQGLKKRQQGKSCFNFKKWDEALLEELWDLTVRCWEWERGVLKV